MIILSSAAVKPSAAIPTRSMKCEGNVVVGEGVDDVVVVIIDVVAVVVVEVGRAVVMVGKVVVVVGLGDVNVGSVTISILIVGLGVNPGCCEGVRVGLKKGRA